MQIFDWPPKTCPRLFWLAPPAVVILRFAQEFLIFDYGFYVLRASVREKISHGDTGSTEAIV